MKSAVETVSDIEIKINVVVPANELQDAYSNKISEVSKTANVTGFRKGKVPANYIKKIYGQSIENDVVDELVRKSFNEVCNEHKINVVGIENVDISQRELGKDLEFAIKVETYPQVEFNESDFAKIKIEKFTTTITEADVDSTIEKLRKSHATWETQSESTKAKMGDKVIIDFTAEQDGEKLEGGSADNFDLELGSKHLIPGFEEGVVGHKAGDTFVLDLVFPEDYHAVEQAGKKTKFTVTLKEVKHPLLPEINEEFCAKFGISLNGQEDAHHHHHDGECNHDHDHSAHDHHHGEECDHEHHHDENCDHDAEPKNIQETLRAKIKESLEAEVKNHIDSKYKNSIFDSLCEIKSVNIPKSLVEAEISDLIENQQARYRNYTGKKNAKLDLDRESFRQQAEKNTHLRLLVRGFIEQNNIKADREVVKTKLSEAMGGHEISEDLLNWYYSDAKRLSQIESLALEDLVTKKIEEKIKVTEKAVNFNDLMEQKA